MKSIFLFIVLGLFFSGCTTRDKNETKTKLVVDDVIKPVITLLGPPKVTLKKGMVYRDAGANASDNIDGNITSKIQTNNPVDANYIGTYLITYNVKDNANNPAKQVTRTVRIVKPVDTIKPIITLLGSATVTIEQGANYNDLGATASDNIDGNITSSIQVHNPVKVGLLGTYLVTYNVKDSANNRAKQVTRTVRIVKPVDTIKPIITLLGSAVITIGQGTHYNDSGATASDNIDGNITSKIQTNNPVNVNHIGTYLITYNVNDSANNPAKQVTRTIHIVKPVDTIKPIITLLGSAVVTIGQGTHYNDSGATASDNIDGNITSSIQAYNPVKVSLLGTYLITYNVKDSANNRAKQVTRTVIVADKTSPLKPRLTITPTEANDDTQEVELNGEVGATIWINGTQKGVIASNGKLVINLDTSGADGTKYFSIILKDSSGNSSEALVFNLLKSSIDPIFNEFNVGFGGSSSFPFTSVTAGEKIYISARSLVLDDDIENNAHYANIKYFDGAAFSSLQGYLKKSKFLVFWFVDGWEEYWYDIPSIQALMDAGYIPIFNYWYFGDKLIEGMPNNVKQDAYTLDNIKVANFLAKLKGKKMLIMEPEFNKRPVLESANTQHEFASIISNAIDIIKDHNPELLVSLSMMDTGSRGVNDQSSKCGYANCSLGDIYAWKQPEVVFRHLSNKLDFISFHQMIGQFSRDPSNPGGWDTPNPKKYTAEELGIDFLAERISNFATFLRDKYNKPVFLPYITVMTATWDEDSNNNQQIEDNEINYNGWQDKANNTYKRLAESKSILKESGLFGFATMALFDNPRQDYGGYQYFINNEYHLGIVGSSAIDEDDIAPYGDLQFKGEILESIFNSGG